YGAFALLDAVGRYPGLWRGDGALEEDVRSIAEVASCLIAYNVDTDTGTVTPRSCSRGFEAFSFGQKKRPSPFATARVLAILSPFSDLANDVTSVDVLALGSSKGGSGTPVGPRPTR
ncbi:MAG TPA: hypothetical protein VF293_03295, partial [Candidatus Limnocylindrales bacterium]